MRKEPTEWEGQIATASAVIQFYPDPNHPKTPAEMVGLYDEAEALALLYRAYYLEVMKS